MGTKLSPKDNELYQRIDEVLHYKWDPLGISNEPIARDEYNSYLPRVFKMVKDDIKAEELAKELQRIEDDRIGLTVDPIRLKENIQIAELLIAYREAIEGKNKDSPS
jgi:hypothetical protein